MICDEPRVVPIKINGVTIMFDLDTIEAFNRDHKVTENGDVFWIAVDEGMDAYAYTVKPTPHDANEDEYFSESQWDFEDGNGHSTVIATLDLTWESDDEYKQTLVELKMSELLNQETVHIIA